MNEDEPMGQGGVTGRASSWWHSARARRQAAEVLQDQSSRQRRDRRAVMVYRVAAAALLIAVATVAFAESRLKNNAALWLDFSDSVVYFPVMLGSAYYLGRTRPAPGTGQRLNWPGRVISVIPIWGLIQIPVFRGLVWLTKRRLLIRNIAITAGSVLVWSLWDERSSPTAGLVVAIAVLQVASIALAVLMSRRMPAAVLRPAGKGSPWGDTTRSQPRSTAGLPDGSPAADEVIEVSPLATGTRRLYWLAWSMKSGAIFIALAVLVPVHFRPFSWGIAGAGVLAALAIAMLIQEDRIRPVAGVALALGLISAICFVPVAFGVLSWSGALGAVAGWGIWSAFFLWLYLRQRRSSGLSDAEIQAAGRVGHLPRRQAGSTAHRVPPPGLWIRGTLGMLCAIPVVIAGLANTIFGVAVISGWIQAALDKLYAFARGSVDALLAGARSEERTIAALATPTEPGMWQLRVRGDLLLWGKLPIPLISPIVVPFGEFLRARLEVYGEVRMIHETPRRAEAEPAGHEASIVVMPLGVPYSPDVLNKVASLSTRIPLLLLVVPTGSRPLEQWPLEQWPLLVRQMHDHGIALPAMDDPVRTIAVLHQATGKKIVFTARKRNQWGYIAAMHEAFRAISSEGAPRSGEASQAAGRLHDGIVAVAGPTEAGVKVEAVRADAEQRAADVGRSHADADAAAEELGDPVRAENLIQVMRPGDIR